MAIDRIATAQPARETEPPEPERDTSERHAGYYVASQSRPALVTSLTSAEISDIFDLVEEAYSLPANGNGHNGNNGHIPGNGDGGHASQP